jgi:hypothetical protein
MPDNQLMRMSDMDDFKQSVAYKLRLNRLDKVSRTLQKHGIIDTHGFLTIEGSQVLLDALWQKNPDLQKEIADQLDKIKKDDKKGKKNED